MATNNITKLHARITIVSRKTKNSRLYVTFLQFRILTQVRGDNKQYLEHMRGSGVSVKESGGSEIWLWMEKAPPIVISPSLDNRGNSGLPSILQAAVSSSAPTAPIKNTNSNIT